MIIVEISRRTLEEELHMLKSLYLGGAPLSKEYLIGAILALTWVLERQLPPSNQGCLKELH